MLGYLRLRLHFLSVAVRERIRPPSPVVPGPRLRHRVHGSTDARGYLEVGERSWRSIEQLLRDAGRDPDAFDSILDYGCGSGRVVRVIPRETTRGRRHITGIDIDASAIAWAQRHLPGIQFETVAAVPPTRFPASAFDLIFAVSVFTHLDEALQFALLAEMRRLLRPGGVLVASVHGEHHRSVRRRTFDMSRGFLYVPGRTGLFKKDGLPDFYQDAQHTRAYVERAWSPFLRVLAYRERGLGGHQDAVVLTRGEET